MWRALTLAVVTFAVLSLGAVAWARPIVDTFIEGYDGDDYLLLYATADSTDPADTCGAYDPDATGDADDLETYAATLANGAGVATVEGTECVFTAVSTVGPQGEVNHGSVVSALVRSLRAAEWEGGLGCLVRVIAQSDHGQGDQQVQAGTALEPAETPEVDLTRHSVTCATPDAGEETVEETVEENGETRGNGHGKPEWAGPPSAGEDHPGRGNGRGRP